MIIFIDWETKTSNSGSDFLPTFTEILVIQPFVEKKYAKNLIKVIFGRFYGPNFITKFWKLAVFVNFFKTAEIS